MLIDIAVPVGIVLNELLSNIFKHAFPDNKGHASIDIFKKGRDNISMIIKDDGIGVKIDFDRDKIKTLGFQVIRNIVENQLSGKIKFVSDNGFACFIEFSSSIYDKRI